jgi:hypothetical protein
VSVHYAIECPCQEVGALVSLRQQRQMKGGRTGSGFLMANPEGWILLIRSLAVHVFPGRNLQIRIL